MHDRTEFSTVVGIFKDRINAEQASDELRRASFNYDQVELLAPGMERSEAGSIKDYLISISMPEEKAIRYHNEFKNGCILIMVNVIDRYQEVLAILHHHGVYFGIGDPPRTIKIPPPPPPPPPPPTSTTTIRDKPDPAQKKDNSSL